jgi:esterase/lipase
LCPHLSKAGIWSYCIRLPGHGVSPHALAATTWHQWREAVERGIVLLTMVCRQLFLVGFSASGVLALEVAAALSRPAAGVVAICPPAELAHYSPRFMPPQPRWHQILVRWRKNSRNYEFVEFEPENPAINFYQNPVAGVTQVEQLLAAGKSSQPEVDIPVLVMGTEKIRLSTRTVHVRSLPVSVHRTRNSSWPAGQGTPLCTAQTRPGRAR